MATLRVTGGALRGRRVPVPPRAVRPTSERARQAFFNIVGDRMEGARFLDLFAGSGIFSFEAISRGAVSATAVDNHRRSIESISRFAKEWDVPVTAIYGDVIAVLPRLHEEFDVVYADPPYEYQDYDALVEGLDRLQLAPDPIVALEHRKRTNPFTAETKRLRLQRRAEYGEVWITFFA
ncbi:MAG: 16S rRNA (guanine(966)-N(2))-methyltransferase RsmD [Acidobacteriota bacterium]|nr:16S rRNA (guanine(966)-N(2))-methyltransferase RsmD [Acidobacteriota bacterium]